MDSTMAHQIANHTLSFQPGMRNFYVDWSQPKGEFDSTRLSGHQVGGNWICPACKNCNYGFRMRCNMKKCGCVRPPDYGRTRSESSEEAQETPRFRMSSSTDNDDDTMESFKDTQSQSGCSEESRNETNSVVTSTPSQGLDEEAQPLIQDANLNKLENLTTADVNHLRFLQSYLGSLIQKAEKEQGGDGPKRKGSHGADEQKQTTPPDSVGDWLCPSCGNINYGFRSACNMRKCGVPRPQNKQLCQIPHENNQNGGVKYVNKISSSQSDVKSQPGSWECTACGNWNYLFREYCNMKRCRAKRPPQHSAQDSTHSKGGPYFPSPIHHSGRVFKQNAPSMSPLKNNIYAHSPKEQEDYSLRQSPLFGGFELSNNINTAALESMKTVIADIWKCAPDTENMQPYHPIGKSVSSDTSEHSKLNCSQLRKEFLAYGHC